MDNFDLKINELHKLIDEYKNIVVTLQNKVVGKGKIYTQDQLNEWFTAEKKLDEVKNELEEIKIVAQDVKKLLPKNSNGGKRKTGRNRKSKKSKTRKRKGKK